MPAGFQAFGNAAGFVGSGAPQFPSIANIKLRLESTSGVTTSSGNVTSWVDQVQSINFTAAGGARPSLIAGQIGNIPAIRFDGVANKLSSTALVQDIIAQNQFWIIGVFKNNSVAAHVANSYDNPGILVDSASYLGGLSADSSRINSGFFGSVDHLRTIAQSTGVTVYAEGILTTASSGTLSLQITTVGSPSTSTNNGALGGVGGTLKIGTNYADAAFWQGDLFALFAGTTISAGELSQLRSYVTAIYHVA